MGEQRRLKMALKIDFMGTLIWTVVLFATLTVIRYLLPRYYCLAAPVIFVVILILANRRAIKYYLSRRAYR